MLKIKSFLLAVCLSPLFLSTLQLPSEAQVTTPSKGPAGSPSGGGNHGSSSSHFGVPKLNIIKIIITIAQQNSLNGAALIIFKSLSGAPKNSIQRSFLVILIGPAPAGNNFSAIPFCQSITKTKGNQEALLELFIALSGLFSVQSSNLPAALPTSVSSKLKSLSTQATGLDQNLFIAQAATGANVDVNQLNTAILAYNKVIDTSSPEAVVALSKNEEFTLIGQTLRKLKAAVL